MRFSLIAVILLTSFSVMAQENNLASTAPKKKVKTEREYMIHERPAMINKFTIRKDEKGAGNVIEIEALNVSGGSISLGRGQGSYGGSVLPPARITDIVSIQGNYQASRNISSSGRGVVMQLLDVVFPYRVRMAVSDRIVEFEIREPGFWRVAIGVTE